jgi:hypothetical protein
VNLEDRERTEEERCRRVFRLEEVCDSFEAAWNAGRGPRIEDYLESGSPSWRERLLDELIALEMALRSRRGDSFTEEEYRTRFVRAASGETGSFVPPTLSPGQLSTEEWGQAAPTGVADPSSRKVRHGPPPVGDEMPAFIGKYRVVQLLGRGGQGEVFRAVHPVLGRDVVIKRPLAGVSSHAAAKLIDEARVLVSLRDPGVVAVLDLDMADGRPFVVFEYVEGRTLSDVLREDRRGYRWLAGVAADLAETLHRCHQQGVQHLDVKPANVLIDRAGRPRLLDFGLATLAPVWGDGVAAQRGARGTPGYMAPEQAAGQGNLGPWTDVFGLGAILYQGLSGHPPYHGNDLREVLTLASRAEQTPVRQVNPRAPAALARLCKKAMAREPRERHPSARALAVELRAWLRRRWIGAAVAGVLAVLLVALAGWRLLPGREEPPPLPGQGPLMEDLTVRVWSPDGVTKKGLKLGEPGALPVRNRESVSIEVRLNQPGYVYLVLLDSEGGITPLYPWNAGSKLAVKDVSAPVPVLPAVQELRCPPEANRGWRMAGQPGLEGLLLLVRREPLPASVDVGQLLGRPKAVAADNPQEWLDLRFVRGRMETPEKRGFRMRRVDDEAEAVVEPLANLAARLQEQFEVVRAVRFAHGN